MSRYMRKVFYASLLALCLASPAWTDDPTRDLGISPKVPRGGIPAGGEYWALIIGINKYQHAPKLETAVADAVGISHVLVDRYGFRPERMIRLLDEQATRQNIERELYRLVQTAGEDDSVFIYYAGHGQYDEQGRLGWWVPVEALPKDPGTYITNASIRDYIQGMRAKHVYLVADSCFSGTLLATRSLPPFNDKFYAKLYAKRSRWGLTSGSTEPVQDLGRDGHSLFAYFLINLLKENNDPYLVPSQIYDRLAPLIANNTDQMPRSEPLKGAGDEGGQFVFHLSVKSPVSEEPAPPTVPGEPQQLARVPPYVPPSGPPRIEREITGKDGGSMVLIPEGEFTMGRFGSGDESPAHRIYLNAYFIGKYEVSVRQFHGFLMASNRTSGSSTWKDVDVEKVGDRPAVFVNWFEANDYCRYYGQRLPTEAEWEKAARGTDNRLYPWGNEAPTPQHANFNKCCDWKGHMTLSPVNDLPLGASPNGVFNMAGNVREWVADRYNGTYYAASPTRNPSGPEIGTRRVVRGGAWTNGKDYIGVTRRDTALPEDRSPALGFRCVKEAN